MLKGLPGHFPFAQKLKETSAPVGVIVLEGCTVKTVIIDSRPYAFSLGKRMNRRRRTALLHICALWSFRISK